MDQTANGNGSWIDKVPTYLGLYVIYVFVSGWTFGSFYLRNLGLSPRWIDLSLYEVLISGFTVLFTGGTWLWPFYLLALMMPIVLNATKWRGNLVVKLVGPLLLFGLIFPLYYVSKAAGLQQAQIEKDPKSSRLPVITFSTRDGKKYVGKLLYLKGEMYFIREAQEVETYDPDDASARLILSVYKADELHEVKVTGYP